MFYTTKPVRMDRFFYTAVFTIKKALLEKGFFYFTGLLLVTSSVQMFS